MATLAEMLRQTGYAKDGQLEAPAPTQPNLSTMAGDYFRQLPAKTAQNAIDMNYMVQNAMPYNPQTGKFDTGPTFSEFANFVPNLMGSTNAVKAVKGMSWETPKRPKNSVLVDIPLDKIEHGESAMSGGKLTFPTAKQIIKEYAEKKTDFPPIDVMGNDPAYEYFDKPFMIYDGSHRYEAAKLRGDNSIKAYVRKDDADAMSALDQLKSSRKELIQEQINKIE